jgi:glycolate oxidase
MMNLKIKNQLIKIVGENRFADKKENLLSFSFDAFFKESIPDVVLFPVSTLEISQIMGVAYQENIPVTCRGAGTNISGGSIPVKQGIVLCLTKMNKIIEINTRDRYAIVQPGVVNYDLQVKLAENNFFYPPDPASYTISTIGGNIAENSGGPRCLKYGVTSDYILSLEVVLASGKIIRCGSKNVKDVTGYNLSALFCGSEGTMGIVTEATVRVVPLPEARRTVLAYFNDLESSANTVADIIGSGILPAAMELMDHMTINAIEDAASLGLPREAKGALLIDIDGPEESVDKQVQQISEKAKSNGAVNVTLARTLDESEQLWKARRSAYSIFCSMAPNIIVEDATVPPSKITEMIKGIRKITDKYNLRVGILAHAGDGNMHPIILGDIQNKEEWHRIEEATREIFELAIRLGGTLSGEHGIGLAKSKYLSLMLNKETLEFMKALKTMCDPKGILNPGKFV